ncbi:MAG: type IV pilin [Candidatus Contendobacter odensis]|uniref:Type IV pilin n=1 Tax=Candidatus Contendibacter odensensis TaxID=1400860 RepID=A0A2G6PFW4_9GAMM|nr:MAG: type IV pilin [Candidatus Contendobacter odensis]
MKKNYSGFTLIEVMIVVAIVAIVAAIAYPSYQEHVRKSRRADAQSVALQAAQWMERFYTDNLRYDQDRAGTGVGDATLFGSSGFTVSPVGGGDVQYNLTLTNITPTTFTLNAAPVAGSAQANDKCGTLTLDEAGVKGISGAAPGVTVADCWK